MTTLTVGFNFRASSGYVTDPTGYTYCLAEEYPIVGRGLVGGGTAPNFGWSPATFGNVGARDRSSAEISRCAGINYVGNNAAPVGQFLVALPTTGMTGSVGLAMGDATSGQNQYFQIYDDTTLLYTSPNFAVGGGSGGVPTSSDQFADAQGNVWSTGATWLANNVVVSGLSFATTLLNVQVGADLGSADNNSSIASIFVSLTSGGGGSAIDEDSEWPMFVQAP